MSIENLEKCAATTCCNGDGLNIYSAHALIVELQERRKQFQYASELAKSLGITPQYLNDIMEGRRAIKPLAAKLGFTHYDVFLREGEELPEKSEIETTGADA